MGSSVNNSTHQAPLVSSSMPSAASRAYHARVSGALDIMEKRRVRSSAPEYFCLMAPCCRVELGPAVLREVPPLAARDWPRYVTAVVLGGRIDGKVVPARKPRPAGSHASNAGAAVNAEDAAEENGRLHCWHAAGGERLYLDFHGVPVSGPGKSDERLPLKKLLAHLDQNWVRKVKEFPVAWSLLWVETVDTETVNLPEESVLAPLPSAPWQGPTRLPYAADIARVEHDREICLATEMEVRVDVGMVPQESQELFLDNFRDEVRRVLHIPAEQVIVLRGGACASGVVQVGLLHPDLTSVNAASQVPSRQALPERTPTASPRATPEPPEEEVPVPNADLTLLWDRLILAVAGDAGRYRLHQSNAFPLLRRARARDLRWHSAIVAPKEEKARLVQALYRIREEQAAWHDDGMDSSDGEMGLSRTRRSERSRTAGEDEAVAADTGVAGSETSSNLRFERAGQQASPRGESRMGSPSVAESRLGEGADEKGATVEVSEHAVPLERHRALSQRRRRPSSSLRPIGMPLRGQPLCPPPTPQRGAGATQGDQGGAASSRPPRPAYPEEVFDRPCGLELEAAAEIVFHRLAWSNDLEGVRRALSSASARSLNAADRRGRRALHIAAAHCSAELVAVLAERGEPRGPLKLEARDARGRTALHYAAYRGDAAVAQCLVTALGFRRLNACEPKLGETAAIVAARAHHLDVLRLLLEGQASANLSDYRGVAPLHAAAGAGAGDCCRLLLQVRAVAEARDAVGRTPRLWALDFGHLEVAALFPKTVGAGEGERGARGAASGVSTAAAPTALAVEAERRAATAPARVSACGPLGGWSTERVLAPVQSARGAAAARRSGLVGEDASGAAVHLLPRPLSDAAREALLQGRADLAEPRAFTAPTWPGEVGSLAVRWRGWTQTTIVGEGSKVGSRTATPTGSKPWARAVVDDCHNAGTLGALRLAPVVAEGAASIAPLRDQVEQVCKKLGGHFCTLCWEHVLEPHPGP